MQEPEHKNGSYIRGKCEICPAHSYFRFKIQRWGGWIYRIYICLGYSDEAFASGALLAKNSSPNY